MPYMSEVQKIHLEFEKSLHFVMFSWVSFVILAKRVKRISSSKGPFTRELQSLIAEKNLIYLQKSLVEKCSKKLDRKSMPSVAKELTELISNFQTNRANFRADFP